MQTDSLPKILQSMSEGDLISLDSLFKSSNLFSSVLASCGEFRDEGQEVFLRQMLREQAEKRLIYSFWANLQGEDEQKYLDFQKSFFKSTPGGDHRLAIYEFLAVNENVRNLVFADLLKFFEDFVSKYKKNYKIV
ncbi:hypothetical protein KJ632_05350 [Patescibacteria group bacterium]|nr:hypothetical protein [Patescibacteria group bacterium]